MNTDTMDGITRTLQQIAGYLQQNLPLLPMELHLLLSALAPIYAGAHASLSRPSSAAEPAKKDHDEDAEEDGNEDEGTTQTLEALSPKDAIIFPLTAAAVLGALYWAITTYGADLINFILGWYLALVGVFSVSKLASDTWILVESFVTPSFYKDQGKIWKLKQRERKVVALEDGSLMRTSPLPGRLGRLAFPKLITNRLWSDRGLVKDRYTVQVHLANSFDWDVALTLHNVICAIVGATAVLYSNLIDSPWWLTNIQGFAVCYGALQLMSPTSFSTGSLLLLGLFCYDIWAVFFTPLMVTVATELDVPIKMVFPRPDEPSPIAGEPPAKSYSMLGLGDIVLPGIMIALALRFDLYLFYLKKQTKTRKASEEGRFIEEVQKEPYVSATGYWGEKFFLRGVASPHLPTHLTTSFPKTYFNAGIVGYVVGMIATIVAMTASKHAQPALLYLVPSVLISLWGTGLVCGDFNVMWDFSEMNLDEELDDPNSELSNHNEEGSSLSMWSWIREHFFGQNAKQLKAGVGHEEKTEKPSSAANSEKGTGGKQKMSVPSANAPLIFAFTIARRITNKSSANSTLEATEPSDSPSTVSSFGMEDAVVVETDEVENRE